MHDELDRLRTHTFLQRLLSHYASLAAADREVWQDRIIVLDDVEATEMTKLHGELLAFGWIEWTPSPKRSSACYRVTTEGVRALRQSGESVVDTTPISSPPPTRRKQKPQLLECAATD